ncbi:hypothetical protein KIPB_005122 [Kipferlia bialata]|uniref:Uncharacterized protein n=1 Tax=Kipferlia bialata TaxID=797122 RepID=A0A9K3CWR6_9EUKA|nr:hypothetical protein KIPB_005122 [Kipferlia bialata]|eukprot:g5122.t1
MPKNTGKAATGRKAKASDLDASLWSMRFDTLEDMLDEMERMSGRIWEATTASHTAVRCAHKKSSGGPCDYPCTLGCSSKGRYHVLSFKSALKKPPPRWSIRYGRTEPNAPKEKVLLNKHHPECVRKAHPELRITSEFSVCPRFQAMCASGQANKRHGGRLQPVHMLSASDYLCLPSRGDSVHGECLIMHLPARGSKGLVTGAPLSVSPSFLHNHRGPVHAIGSRLYAASHREDGAPQSFAVLDLDTGAWTPLVWEGPDLAVGFAIEDCLYYIGYDPDPPLVLPAGLEAQCRIREAQRQHRKDHMEFIFCRYDTMEGVWDRMPMPQAVSHVLKERMSNHHYSTDIPLSQLGVVNGAAYMSVRGHTHPASLAGLFRYSPRTGWEDQTEEAWGNLEKSGLDVSLIPYPGTNWSTAVFGTRVALMSPLDKGTLIYDTVSAEWQCWTSVNMNPGTMYQRPDGTLLFRQRGKAGPVCLAECRLEQFT